MWTPLKTNFVVAAVAAALTFGLNSFHNGSELTKYQDQVKMLLGQQEVLVKQLDDTNIQIQKDVTIQDGYKKTIEKSNIDLNKATSLIASIKHEVVIVDEKDPKSTIAKITELYNDSTTTFATPRFQILNSTTYTMLGDAENWKVNGPILTDTVAKYKFGWDSANESIKDRNDLILQDQFVIADHKAKEDVLTNLNTNKDKQIVDVNQMLHLEQNNVKLKAVEGFFAGIVLYYLKDKIRKP